MNVQTDLLDSSEQATCGVQSQTGKCCDSYFFDFFTVNLLVHITPNKASSQSNAQQVIVFMSYTRLWRTKLFDGVANDESDEKDERVYDYRCNKQSLQIDILQFTVIGFRLIWI